MNSKTFKIWFSVAGVIGICFGITYAFFGLGVLPVPGSTILPWNNGVYGATLIGLSVLLLFVGRHAFATNDRKLMKALLYGLFSWLIIEALFSVYYGVYSNAGVDVGLMLLLGYPLIKCMKKK